VCDALHSTKRKRTRCNQNMCRRDGHPERPDWDAVNRFTVKRESSSYVWCGSSWKVSALAWIEKIMSKTNDTSKLVTLDDYAKLDGVNGGAAPELSKGTHALHLT
jgi:hypothetical protein